MKRKRIIRAAATLLVFALLMLGCGQILRFKNTDSIRKMASFYDQTPNTVDVLTLGTSHAFQGVNTAVLWDEFGIAGYDLCTAAQHIAGTYYYLEEALKTQTPKAIVLDTFGMCYQSEYPTTAVGIKTTYGMKWSRTKVDAIRASFDPEKYGKQFLFEFLQSHARYNDLSYADFAPLQGNPNVYAHHKGFYCYFKTKPMELSDYAGVEGISPVTEKNEEYFGKIVDLAREKQIPLICVAIPYDADNGNVRTLRCVKELCEIKNVPFYNFVETERGLLNLDSLTDFADTSHLNYLGSTKLTRFLGKLLREQYGVPDRRGNDAYSSWEDDAAVYRAELANHRLTEEADPAAYRSAVAQDRYVIMMTVNDFTSPGNDSAAQKAVDAYLETFGVKYKYWQTLCGAWAVEDGRLTTLDPRVKNAFLERALPGRHDLYVKVTGSEADEDLRTTMYFDGTAVSNEQKGLCIAVYDTFTQSLADIAYYSTADGAFTHVALSDLADQTNSG